MARVVFIKPNEFRFSQECGVVCSGCEGCSVLVVRKFAGFGEVPFLSWDSQATFIITLTTLG